MYIICVCVCSIIKGEAGATRIFHYKQKRKVHLY